VTVAGFPRADAHAALDPDVLARWQRYGRGDDVIFPQLLGLEIEDLRVDYCRMRMPFKPELLQAAGMVHGGAIASLLDTVVVPAVGSTLPRGAAYSTVDMHIQFMRPLAGGDRAEDAVAEGWVTKRGRSTAFCESEAFGATSGTLLAKSVLTYSLAFPGHAGR
jgi:uncharacterized protein (TIGR00369 family)